MAGALKNCQRCDMVYNCVVRGYGLVVERVLAKDESGVRFSVPAQNKVFCGYSTQFAFVPAQTRFVSDKDTKVSLCGKTCGLWG